MKRILRETNTLSQYQEDTTDAVHTDDEAANTDPLVAVYPVDESPDDEQQVDKNPDY
jgi:hypothetical protein